MAALIASVSPLLIALQKSQEAQVVSRIVRFARSGNLSPARKCCSRSRFSTTQAQLNRADSHISPRNRHYSTRAVILENPEAFATTLNQVERDRLVRALTNDSHQEDTATPAKDEAVAPISRTQLRQLFLRGMLPMCGFGFVDNFIMLTAGDAIDNSFGAALGISTLAAAGLGNLVSDVAGLGLSSTIENTASKVGIPCPNLSSEQLRTSSARLAMLMASIIGISIGCLLGMVPLWFMSTEAATAEHVFRELDVDENGVLTLVEVDDALRSVGIEVDEDKLHDCLGKGADVESGISLAQFKKIWKMQHDRHKLKSTDTPPRVV
eukprot:m.120859 g.120859  ORF g.120859 m.120859 type:complete len:323 (-) comp17256_c0_seq1:117-1085(-)